MQRLVDQKQVSNGRRQALSQGYLKLQLCKNGNCMVHDSVAGTLATKRKEELHDEIEAQ